MKHIFSSLLLCGIAFASGLLLPANPAIGSEEHSAPIPSLIPSFSAMDINHDHKLSHDEAVLDANTVVHFEGADRDRNGVLTVSEYEALKTAEQQNQLDVLSDDNSVTAEIQRKLADVLKTSQTNIHVDTYKGTVFLNGYVESESQCIMAARVARDIAGVSEVKNGLIAKG